MKILFLCVANSARSQMAEGLARQLLGTKAEVYSAGSRPSGKVHRFALQALEELGIETASLYSKGMEEIDMESMDYVITLCAEEICPVYLGKAQKLHWPIQDPAAFIGSLEGQMNAFRKARDQIRDQLVSFFKA